MPSRLCLSNSLMWDALSFFYISFLQYLTSTPYQVLLYLFCHVCSFQPWLRLLCGYWGAVACWLPETTWRRCWHLSGQEGDDVATWAITHLHLLFRMDAIILFICLLVENSDFFFLDYCEKGCFGCGSSNNLFRTFRLIFAYSETIVESCINYVGNFLLQKLSWEFHIHPFTNFPDLPPASYPHSSVPFFSPLKSYKIILCCPISQMFAIHQV